MAVARLVRAGRGLRASAFPVLEVSDHALGRLYQRSPGVDAAAALVEAVRAFLAADITEVLKASRRGETVYLPTASGCCFAR